MDTEMISRLMQPPSLKDIHKLLCVQPHPDDNEIGMGGVIAELVKQGCHVDYLTVTNGSLGDVGLTDGSIPLAEVRRTEAEKAGRFLGASEFYFLEEKDGTLNNVPPLAWKIAEILRAGQYDAVACPDPWTQYEAHHDHIVTGQAVAQAAINCDLLHYPEGTATQPAHLKAVLFYLTQKPNTSVDITESFEKKMKSIAIHASQISAPMLELYTGYFAFRGQRMSQSDRIFEGLKVLAPMHLHCIAEAAEI